MVEEEEIVLFLLFFYARMTRILELVEEIRVFLT